MQMLRDSGMEEGREIETPSLRHNENKFLASGERSRLSAEALSLDGQEDRIGRPRKESLGPSSLLWKEIC